jgi:hypothetical protein
LISWLIALSLWFAPFIKSPRFGGTFIGAVVAEDGIVLGADSRSTFIDADNHPMGYVDGMQKIYVGSSSAVAISGLTSVDGELFNSFVDRNLFLLQRPADEVLFGFAVWLPYKNSVGVMLLSAGFNHGRPAICARSVFQPQACQEQGSITNKPSPSLQTWVSSLKAPPKAAAAALALKRAIQESAASDVSVGGPISLVELRSGGLPVWLESPPARPDWKTVCDVVRDHRVNKIRIVPSASSSDLDRYLVSICR